MTNDDDVLMIWVQKKEVPDDDRSNVRSGNAIPKGFRAAVTETAEAVIERIPVAKLRANLHAVCSNVVEVLKDIKKVGDFELSEVTLQVEVGAEGGVALIGTANVSSSGAISLTFKKPGS